MSTSQRRQSVFRPCIDLHDGKVKQIVGGTLSDDKPEELKTNFVARRVWVPFRCCEMVFSLETGLQPDTG